MQGMGTGSPKEDIVTKLMRTALLIGLAVTWRPDAAAGAVTGRPWAWPIATT